MYANSRAKIDAFQTWCENKLDTLGDSENKLYNIDVVKVTGPLMVREKAHHLCTFMEKGTSNYNPRILVATSSATNAGIDSDKIYGVYRLDMPSSRINMVQERGRAGRFAGATPSTYSYCVNFPMSSFEYKLIQILSEKKHVLDATYRREMENALLETLILLMVAPKCISQQLEEMMANPDKDTVSVGSETCKHCFVCNNYIRGKKKWKKTMTKLLWSVMGKKEEIEGELTTDIVTNAIRKRKEDCKNVFNVAEPACRDVEGTLLMLIAGGLVNCLLKKDEEDNEYIVLELAAGEEDYVMRDDNAWNVIPERYFRESKREGANS